MADDGIDFAELADDDRIGAALAEANEALGRRVVELERQRAAVLALCDEAEQDEPSAVFSQGGPVWGVWTEDVRRAMDGGE